MRAGPDSLYDTLTEENTGGGTGVWTIPTSVYSRCGQESGYPATATIDNNTDTDWRHLVNERHWIVTAWAKA